MSQSTDDAPRARGWRQSEAETHFAREIVAAREAGLIRSDPGADGASRLALADPTFVANRPMVEWIEHEWAVLPDRGQVTMTAHFLRSYSQLVIKTCHRREVHAMGGMAAQIPIKNDTAANEIAMDRVRADKKREAGDGHDGTWVAHPGLVEIAKSEFDAVMKQANQIARKRQDVNVTAADLIQMPSGPKTEAGLRQNVAVGIGYVEAWLRGIGCVPLFNLMEDAATAEISRAQVWQWVRHNQKLDDGRAITKELVREIVREENDKVKAQMGEENYAKGRYEDAAQLMIDLVEQPQFYEFLTLPAYDRIIADEKKAAA